MKLNYATPEDLEKCREIHRQFGTTYYYSTRRFPERVRWRVHAIYAFARIPDEWVDNPGSLTADERLASLRAWREELRLGLHGQRPDHFALRAFCDAAADCRIPPEEAELFLTAMEQDIVKTRYETYAELQGYMRGSASAIGVMMCYAMCARTDFDTLARAKALGEAMQLTNFLRDVGEDVQRGRIYLPLEDLAIFGLTEADVANQKITPALKDLMKFEIERARQLYSTADYGILKLPGSVRPAVLLARLLYAQILNRIEDQDYNVFVRRARTSLPQKARCAAQVAVAERRILDRLLAGQRKSLTHPQTNTPGDCVR